MTNVSHDVSPQTLAARQRLGALAAFGAAGLALSATYRSTGIGLPCPWRMLTGTLCPFCGATTMGADLLSGNVAKAWSDNAFVLSGLVGLAIAAAFWIVAAVGGPSLQLPGVLRNRRVWVWTITAVAVAFGIVRNL